MKKFTTRRAINDIYDFETQELILKKNAVVRVLNSKVDERYETGIEVEVFIIKSGEYLFIDAGSLGKEKNIGSRASNA